MDIQSANYNSYNILNESDMSNILEHFTPEYMYDIMDNVIEANKSNSPISYSMPHPNLVASFESNFKYLANIDSESEDKVESLRIEVYSKLIEFLCKRFDLSLNIDTALFNDYFSLAYHLYDFLISNFNVYLTTFLTNFIYNEKDQLFLSMNLEEQRKNKDSATIYGKKIFNEDPKFAIMIANLNQVLQNIMSFDFPFETIVCSVCGPQPGKLIATYIVPNNDFFNTVYKPAFNNPVANSILITNIRLMLQQKYINEQKLREEN